MIFYQRFLIFFLYHPVGKSIIKIIFGKNYEGIKRSVFNSSMNLLGLYKKKTLINVIHVQNNMLIVRYFYVNKDENNRKEKKNHI